MLQSYRRKPTHLRSQAKTIIGCIEKNKHYDTDDDRIADMVMFLFAGHDTTAYSLAWTFLELARNPKESLRLREALNGNDDMRAQGLLKDVLREGMRLRPVYPGIGVRTLGKDFHLKDKGTVIPKGSQIIFPSMILTRYGVEDAEQFQPSRWTEHPNKSFLLFSSGPHHCAGKSLALAEMTWVLSRLCAQYKFQVVDEGNPHFCVFWKCRGAKLQVREA
jgi:cytochrome P450